MSNYAENIIAKLTAKQYKWITVICIVGTVFITENALQISHKFTLGKDLEKVIAQHINNKSHRNIVASKKMRSSTKPKCTTKDSTLYRIINTISTCKDFFMKTKHAHNKDDQNDTRKGKAGPW